MRASDLRLLGKSPAETLRTKDTTWRRRIVGRRALVVGLISGLWGVTAPPAVQGSTQAADGLVVQVGLDRLVSTSLPARPLVEPHVATNPRDPQHLVGAAIMSVRNEADLLQMRCVSVASFDGARTWIAHEFSVPRCHDPWVAILDDGTAIVLALETDNSGAAPHLWLFRSPDGGRTWPAAPYSFGPGHDHPTIVVDRTGGRFHGALYVVSTGPRREALGRRRENTFVARSTDGGLNFSQVTEHEMTNLVSVTLTAAVLPDGTLLVPVGTFQRRVADTRRSVWLTRRLDWTIRSTDGGVTFSPPLLITDTCGGADSGGGAGFHSLAVDLSDLPRRGRAYFVCHDGRRSGPYVVRSDDGGNLWSDPVHVPKTLPSDASGQRRTPSIAVNRDGIVAVSWHDRGSDISSNCWDVFAAFSGDGGETFTDAHKVSTQSSCPAAGDNGWTTQRWPFGGEYSGLAAAADGAFHLFWPDSRAERYELRTAQVRVTRAF
jgi:hypothetical protein